MTLGTKKARVLFGICVSLFILFWTQNGLALVIEEWVARFDNLISYDDSANAITVDYCGNVYVSGRNGSSDFSDYATIKYDSSVPNSGCEVYRFRKLP